MDGGWYRDRAALRFIALRYLPLLAVLNFAWEWGQVRLYTIWEESGIGYISFAIAHCTLGDVLIGAATLLVALAALRAPPLGRWNLLAIGILATILGVGYTAVSEWLNTVVWASWQYSSAMPLVEIGGVRIGVSPLAQWMIVPPLALYLATRASRARA